MIQSTLAGFALVCIGVSAATALTRWPADQDRYHLGSLPLHSAPVCRVTVPRLAMDSLGPLRPGQILRDVERVCPRLLYGWDWGTEGIPAPAVVLRLGGSVVKMEFPDTASSSGANRVSTDSRLVKTVDGFGPGSSLTAMTRAWGPPTFGAAECVLYVWFSSHPGLSFRVDVPKRWRCEDVLAVGQGNSAKLPPGPTGPGAFLFRKEQ